MLCKCIFLQLQDLLMHLALEEGCLKAGQRYWACFALRQVASRLSADSMRSLLGSNAQHPPRIEDGALLLVRACSIPKTIISIVPFKPWPSHTWLSIPGLWMPTLHLELFLVQDTMSATSAPFSWLADLPLQRRALLWQGSDPA